MTPARLFAAVLAFDVLGGIVAVAAGLDPAGSVLVNGTPINAPGPFVAVQAAVVLWAVRARRRRSVAASGLVLGALCAVSVVSGFTDGSYDAALSLPERIVQELVVAATAALCLVALTRARGALARRPLGPAA